MWKQGKNNALILYQVLMKYSDKEHPLSMSDIKDYMAEETAECGRDSIARYLNQLEEEMGIDIHRGKGQAARYYIDRRLLDKEELPEPYSQMHNLNTAEVSSQPYTYRAPFS